MTKRSSFLLKNGKQLSYAEYGNPDGFPVLALHGLAGSVVSDDLQNAVPQDSPIRLIVTARPGYGESEYFDMSQVLDWAKELEPFLNFLEIKTFDAIAFSAGAPYAYSLTYAYPSRARRLYINGGLPALYHPDILPLYGDTAIPFYQWASKASYEEVGQRLDEIFFQNLPPEYLSSADVQDSRVNGCRGMAREAKLQAVDWGFELTEITHPVTIIHSKTDQQVALAAVEKTAALLPNCKTIVLEDGSHCDDPSTALAFQFIVENL